MRSLEALLERRQDCQLDERAAEAAVGEVLRDGGVGPRFLERARRLDLANYGL